MQPAYDHAGIRIYQGDALTVLRELPGESVDCCVTSPPYYGLRDYGVDGQIGLEDSPEAYLARLVEVFWEVRRVLRPEGTIWVNMGDAYAGSNQTGGRGSEGLAAGIGWQHSTMHNVKRGLGGLKTKDLLGMPWRLAFALQADGWYLRQEIIWHKPNVMPESVRDRPTRCHEQVFLLAKSERYFYDATAISEDVTGNAHARGNGVNPKALDAPLCTADGASRVKRNASFSAAIAGLVARRNRRSVWTIPTEAYADAHFATFPQALVEPCIMAGSSERGVCVRCGRPWRRVVEKHGTWRERKAAGAGAGNVGRADDYQNNVHGKGVSHDLGSESHTLGWAPTCNCGTEETRPAVVLDPFLGSGTSAAVAKRLGRHAVGIELNPQYIDLAARRLEQDVLPLTQEALP